ncbi:dihydrolipoamide acetyltransferase family protein [Pedosphaera parvula]|uniref:Dihydrolipoamide acetyltransferase component of pyruvate dehydrogenase complex n=1 Tax=Pedosphaera parvula (strain Ellin514) TaxID=320771 RepID=B9X9V7_PEDPL|nr:dihydrolipoamide acetyltransferase family protein [Pedosphaera parvula]EEF63298.1 catalytic domain of component of various dehydrogenase complexes [Pedosphaera parvula Ellin514]
MSAYVEMPKLSDTMTEGTVVKWRKAVGDTVEVGDILAEIETDKAVMEMESFEEGVLNEIYVQPGEKAAIGQKLAMIGTAGEKAPAKANGAPVAEKAKVEATKAAVIAPQPAAKPQAVSGSRVKASPLAKKIATSKGVDISSLQGSGPGGRVVAKDVEGASASAPAPKSAAPAPIAVPAPTLADKRIPLTGMRKVIAERLLQSKTQIPHFYLHIEVNAEELMRTRGQINTLAEKSGQAKLTVNDFVLKAAIMAAVRVPAVNASFAGDAVVQYANINMAVAVAIDDGLVTPVIREAQKKSLREINEIVKDLATRARTKKLKPDEYQGGTITVSNLGSYGIENFSAIINPPQAMILSVGAIVKKPVVNDKDQIVVGQRMSVGLSADHRVVDGAIGAQYLAELRQILENPVTMLL